MGGGHLGGWVIPILRDRWLSGSNKEPDPYADGSMRGVEVWCISGYPCHRAGAARRSTSRTRTPTSPSRWWTSAARTTTRPRRPPRRTLQVRWSLCGFFLTTPVSFPAARGNYVQSGAFSMYEQKEQTARWLRMGGFFFCIHTVTSKVRSNMNKSQFRRINLIQTIFFFARRQAGFFDIFIHIAGHFFPRHESAKILDYHENRIHLRASPGCEISVL